jgi:hypothetical protein
MAIKFALKDTTSKSPAETKSTAAKSTEMQTPDIKDAPDSDLFEPKPADQKRKKKKW